MITTTSNILTTLFKQSKKQDQRLRAHSKILKKFLQSLATVKICQESPLRRVKTVKMIWLVKMSSPPIFPPITRS